MVLLLLLLLQSIEGRICWCRDEARKPFGWVSDDGGGGGGGGKLSRATDMARVGVPAFDEVRGGAGGG